MKYYIFTFGCQMNKSDSEKIAAILEKQGHKPAAIPERADLIVLNACSVRQSAIDRIYGKINQIHKLQTKNYKLKTIILAGCVLEHDKNKLTDKVAEFWEPNRYFTCVPSRQKSNLAYVPIMTGCNNFCSYCVVPYTRGREKSRPAEEIIEEVKSLLKKGYKEIVLLGQNVNSYNSQPNTALFPEQGAKRRVEGSDPSTTPRQRRGSAQEINFSQLLKILNALPGDFQISFLTSHPKDMSEELIETIAQCAKVKKEIHLPVQSGDNKILKAMNRHYTITHYKNLIKKIRRQIPEVKISTDVIVGFPDETKKQFQNTVNLFKEIKFNKAYIAKYSPRLSTAAAKLKDNVPIAEKKRRWQILNEIIKKKKPSFGG